MNISITILELYLLLRAISLPIMYSANRILAMSTFHKLIFQDEIYIFAETVKFLGD